MTVNIRCPHCGAASTYVAGEIETEVTCFSCLGRYLPSAAQREEPRPGPGPRPIRGFGVRAAVTEDERRGPSRYRSARLREEIGTPAVFLLILWILGSLAGSVLVLLVLFSLLRADKLGPAAKSEQPILVVFGAVNAVLIPAGLYGAICMVRGTSYRWSVASAVLLLVGYPCCLLSWIATIWALVALRRPGVRAAFESNRSGRGGSGF
ncbi:MAG: hypothetical protein J0I06_22585 [Planctomycetes bacterium]|nr:hypothetical protein [Planctomycetota bacterium]